MWGVGIKESISVRKKEKIGVNIGVIKDFLKTSKPRPAYI